MLIYTIILLFISLAPYFYGFAGTIYFTAAVLLGLKFLHHAGAVYKDPAERNAKRMFGFSIIYLFMLFLILVIDNLLFTYIS